MQDKATILESYTVNICNILLLKIQTSSSFHKKYENNSQHHSQINKRGVLFQNVTHNRSPFWYCTGKPSAWGLQVLTDEHIGFSVTTQQLLQQVQELVCCIQTRDKLNLEEHVVSW